MGPSQSEDMKRNTIVLADDDPNLLESVQKLLIVTDISMEGLSGIRAARRLKSEQPNARIIFLTVHDESAFVAEAHKVGALGYVIKRSADSDLIPAIHAALQGRSFVSSAARH